MQLVVEVGGESSPDREPADAPPSYSDSIANTPPPYEALIARSNATTPETYKYADRGRPPFYVACVSGSLLPPVGSMTKDDLDWADTSSFKQAGKHKKKSQAKSWADGSGDEGAENGGGGGDMNGQGGGDGGGDGTGAGAGGVGGDGGGGGGGGDDEWNNWDTGKKKKGKKAKEEEKKKKEEEEAKQKEEEEAKKKEEESNPLSWADEDPGDEWGGFTPAASKKDKKDKKKKVGFYGQLL